MRVSSTSRFRVPPNVLVSKVGAESVILDLNSEKYFGLDETGTAMWEALVGGSTFESACAALLDEFEVEPELLRRDLSELVEQLSGLGLLEVVAEAGPGQETDE
jgi:hypothetical protein